MRFYSGGASFFQHARGSVWRRYKLRQGTFLSRQRTATQTNTLPPHQVKDGSLLCARVLGPPLVRGGVCDARRPPRQQPLSLRCHVFHNAHECSTGRATHGGCAEGDGGGLPGGRLLGGGCVQPLGPAQGQEDGARDATGDRGRRPYDDGRHVLVGREGRGREARGCRRALVFARRRRLPVPPVPHRLLWGREQGEEGRVGLQRQLAVAAQEAPLQQVD